MNPLATQLSKQYLKCEDLILNNCKKSDSYGNMLIAEEKAIISEHPIKQMVDIEKIKKFFSDPLTETMVDMQTMYLQKLITALSSGIYLHQLQKVVSLLTIIVEKNEDSPVFMTAVTCIIKSFAIPFLKEKTSDEIIWKDSAVTAISNFGYLMRIKNFNIKIVICETILNLYGKIFKNEKETNRFSKETASSQMRNTNELTDLEMSQCRGEYLTGLIEESDFAETMIRSLSWGNDSSELQHVLLLTIVVLSENSKTNCNKILGLDGITKIGTILQNHIKTSNHSDNSLIIDALWNITTNSDCEQLKEKLKSKECMKVFFDLLYYFTCQSNHPRDRPLRNDLMVILSNILQLDGTIALENPRIIKLIASCAVCPELVNVSRFLMNYNIMVCGEDFEFKKLMLIVIQRLIEIEPVRLILRKYKILSVLFYYVIRDDQKESLLTNRKELHWNQDQFEALQLLALSVIETVIPYMISEFIQINGETQLLYLLNWCVSPNVAFKMIGNNNLGTMSHGTRLAQLKYAIRILRGVVKTGDKRTIQNLTRLNVMETLLGVLQNELNNVQKFFTAKNFSSLNTHVIVDAMFVIARLCEASLILKRTFGELSGVQLLTKVLRNHPSMLKLNVDFNLIFASTIDCCWAAIIKDANNEKIFIKSKGVDEILNLLTCTPYTAHNLLLSFLLDLTDNEKSLTSILTWTHPKTLKKGPHFLCELWRKEETNLGCLRTIEGAIDSIIYPLAGTVQRALFERRHVPVDEEDIKDFSQYELDHLQSDEESFAIKEIGENLRSKIYAIFSRIGFIHLPGLENSDHITLCIIENYLDFKMGEIWMEILNELKRDDIEPTQLDQEAIHNILQANKDRARATRITQFALNNKFAQRDLQEEVKFYENIRKNFKQEQKNLSNAKSFLEKTSKYLRLKKERVRQLQKVNLTRPTDAPANMRSIHTFHDLLIGNNTVGAMLQQSVTIESNMLDGTPSSKLLSTTSSMETAYLREHKKVDPKDQQLPSPAFPSVMTKLIEHNVEGEDLKSPLKALREYSRINTSAPSSNTSIPSQKDISFGESSSIEDSAVRPLSILTGDSSSDNGIDFGQDRRNIRFVQSSQI
ncbi:hypothetical protein SNEBB_004655 [Seison nebaliae]|nr:hypothetical protein SNEBB_004655 [Seison nebaliae]